VRRLTWLAVGIGGLLVVSGCGIGSSQEQSGSADQPSTGTPKPTPDDGTVLVRYELTGTAVSIDGTYAEPDAGKERMVELRGTALPWRRSFSLPPKQLFVAGLVAQGPNLESTITCKIMKDSEIIAQQTGPTVDCRAEVS
jgi:hypothetical protein